MRYLLDSWIWIEYLIGSKLGCLLKDFFNDKNNQFFTLESSLSEIKGYCLKNNFDFEESIIVVKNNSSIIPIRQTHWLDASEIKFELRKTRPQFGIMDALLLSFQKELCCKIITGDEHFKGLKNVILV